MAEQLHIAPGSSMTIRVSDGDPTVLVVQGDLDAVGLVLFRQLVEPLLTRGVRVRADLGSVEFASLKAASYLVGDHLRTVAVVAPSRAVERAVELVRLCEVDGPDGANGDLPSSPRHPFVTLLASDDEGDDDEGADRHGRGPGHARG
jgi:hypothetical protein